MALMAFLTDLSTALNVRSFESAGNLTSTPAAKTNPSDLSIANLLSMVGLSPSALGFGAVPQQPPPLPGTLPVPTPTGNQNVPINPNDPGITITPDGGSTATGTGKTPPVASTGAVNPLQTPGLLGGIIPGIDFTYVFLGLVTLVSLLSLVLPDETKQTLIEAAKEGAVAGV